jgi:L-asparaginase II
MTRGPLLIVSTRGAVVENRHRVSLAVVDAAGRLVRSHGDVDAPVPARSSVKPLQALALLRSGAADAFEVTDQEVAIACASHSGEPGHVELVSGWLRRLGLDEEALGCAPALPRASDGDVKASRLAHNCSGKHTGFLAVAAHLDVDPAAYLDVDAPVQRLVLDGIAQACEIELAPDLIARDGCSAPAACLPLSALALGLSRTFLGEPDAAAMRILSSMAEFPWLVGGTERFDTEASIRSGGGVITKAGADGMHVAIARHAGLTMAAKCHDGSRRPVELALARALVEADALTEGDEHELVDVRIRDDDGRTVGELRLA